MKETAEGQSAVRAGGGEGVCPWHGAAEGEPAEVTLAAAAAIPGPAPTPILGWRGNVLRYFRQPIRYMTALRRDYGDVVCLARGGNDPLIFRPLGRRTATVFAFGAECNRQVLTQPNLFESDVVRTPPQCAWLGDNLVSANRQERARQRRTILPAFAADHLRAYYGDVVGLTRDRLDQWRPGSRIDLTHEVDDLCAEIASKTFYGQNLKAEPHALAAIAREVTELLFQPLTQVPIDLPGTPYRRFLRLTRQAEAAVLAEIEKRRAAGSEDDDVLSMMLRAIREGDVHLPETHLVGNAFTLFLAGHDVPANGLGWTLFLLAQHPGVAADLLDELTEHLGGGPPTYEQIWKLPLLDRVVNESLRVLSPAVLIWRRPSSDAALGGYRVPAGCEVILSPYMTHVDPAIWSAPRSFRPERWNEIKPTPFEYLPFSYGARKCLGAAFAEILLKIVVAMVVQRYRLEVLPGARIDLKVTMTMKPRKGLPMVVREQDRRFDRSRGEVRGDVRDMVDL